MFYGFQKNIYQLKSVETVTYQKSVITKNQYTE